MPNRTPVDVDESSAESFPASDPPSWTTSGSRREESSTPEPPPRADDGHPELFPTRNDLPQNARAQLVELLNARLADAIDLATQCKQAHWNVKGPAFFALHQLFDQVSKDAREYVDLIAERAVQLGGQAEGTARIAAQRSSLPEYGARGADEREHLQALTAALSAFARVARGAVSRCNQFDDFATADLFTEISRGTEKWLWMVESHLWTQH
ncbi:MAG: DNA starvation/stationary phase protection protein Dps [Myxococcaceae bacterium]